MGSLKDVIKLFEAKQNGGIKTILPIPFDAIDLVISAETMELHYDKLYTKYVNKSIENSLDEFSVAGSILHGLFFEQFCIINDDLPGKKFL